MKALIFNFPMNMEFKDVTIPIINNYEVLIKVRAVGICGSDVHSYFRETGRRVHGISMGHEVSGVVVKTGRKVKNIKINDKVAVQPVIYCGKCKPCKLGNSNICINRKTIGVDIDGAYAEYLKVPATNVFKLPDSLDFTLATLCEPMSVAVHAVNFIPNKCDSIAIIGTGTIGLLVLFLLTINKKISKIFVIEKSKFKLNLAEKFGGISVESDEKLKVDYCIEAVGISETVNLALKVTREKGEIIVIGMSPEIKFNLNSLILGEKTLKGSYCYREKEFKQSITIVDKYKNKLKQLISKIVKFDELQDTFYKLAKSEESIKTIIEIG